MARHGGGAFSRQGSDQGRPLGGLRGPLGRQERRRGRARRALRGAGRLRHRRRAPGLASWSRRSAPSAASPPSDRRRRAASTSTCARRRSSATSTCAARSTAHTAAYGHFGRAGAVGDTDKVDALRAPSADRRHRWEERVEQRGRGRRRRQGQDPRRGAAAPELSASARGSRRLARPGHAGILAGSVRASCHRSPSFPSSRPVRCARPSTTCGRAPRSRSGDVVHAPLGPRTVRGVVVGPAERRRRARSKSGPRHGPADRRRPRRAALEIAVALRVDAGPGAGAGAAAGARAPRRTFWAALGRPANRAARARPRCWPRWPRGPLPLPALRTAPAPEPTCCAGCRRAQLIRSRRPSRAGA